MLLSLDSTGQCLGSAVLYIRPLRQVFSVAVLGSLARIEHIAVVLPPTSNPANIPIAAFTVREGSNLMYWMY